MDRCALFVDAGYALADGAMAVHGTRRRDSVSWDHAGLLKLLAGLARDRTGLPVLRCYWYEAADGGRTAEHDELAEMPGLKLRLVNTRPGRREGIESQLRRDVVTLAKSGAIADAFIASADEHLAEIVAEVQDLGLRVVVLHIASDGGWTIPQPLRQECDDIVEISGVHLRPFVDLIRGAEPSVSDHHYAGAGHGSRSHADGDASMAAAMSHAGLPAQALPAPVGAYQPSASDYGASGYGASGYSSAQPYANGGQGQTGAAGYEPAGAPSRSAADQALMAARGNEPSGGSSQQFGVGPGGGPPQNGSAGQANGSGPHADAISQAAVQQSGIYAQSAGTGYGAGQPSASGQGQASGLGQAHQGRPADKVTALQVRPALQGRPADWVRSAHQGRPAAAPSTPRAPRLSMRPTGAPHRCMLRPEVSHCMPRPRASRCMPRPRASHCMPRSRPAAACHDRRAAAACGA